MTHTRATLVWCLVGAMAMMTIGSFALAGLTVDLRSNPWLPLAITVLLATSFFYRFRRPNPQLCAVTEAAAQMLLILLFGILLTYAAMTANFPYRDADFYAIDQALGLDRRAYLDFVNSRPLLAGLAGYAYLTLLPQFALVPMVLMVANRLPHLRRWMVALGLALMATSAISVFTPAVAAFVYLDLTPQVYANISSTVYTHVPTLEALRAGTLHSLHLDNLEGLITFPSFHTAGALMFIWALRTVPYVRWPAIALNSALIAATPIDGAHYFIDLVGGALVAFVAIAASHWLCRYVHADEMPAVAIPAAAPEAAESSI
ncbi:MAG TPA: phosphatase PAP2 family protein [Pseudolabrys sp.]|nr:phosphatase PAP2 family protein [Pseudolabrys sp.]